MINRDNTLPIAQEGFKKIAYIITALFISTLLDLDLLQLALFTLLLMALWIFRNPERTSAHLNSSNTLLSVCDGTVVDIKESSFGNKSEYKKIVIENSYMDVGQLRAPFDGSISNLKIVHGAHLSQKNSLSSEINEYASYSLEDREGATIFVEHQLYNSIHNIDIKTVDNEPLSRCKRFGFMIKGRTTITIANSARISVSLGQEVSAGESILAYL